MLTKIRYTFELVKFSHSLFALPFALSSLLFATDGRPDLKLLMLVIVAMVCARNAAMAFNRLVDADIDAQNPRTLSRHIPAHLLSRRYVALFTLINSILFIIISSLFNRLSLILSPIALIVMLGYSLTKRITHFTQIFLGIALGIAPIAAWIAAKGVIDSSPLLMGLGVLFWVAGFDILYATQDYQFDKKAGLKSLVVWLSIPKALKIALFFHLVSILSFLSFGIIMGTSWVYFAAVGFIAILLAIEHLLINPDNLSRINAAFFTMNGLVGMVYLMGSFLELRFY